MKGKNPSAQELTIRLLEYLAPVRKAQIREQVSTKVNGSTMEQVNLCLMMASERNRVPQSFLPQSFIVLAQTILALQRGCKPEMITMVDIYLSMKNGMIDEDTAKKSAGTIVNRIEDHARLLRPEEIDGLCGRFRKESNHLFWKNEIYRMFPELPVEDAEDGPVLDGLQALWDSLSADEQKRMREIFPARADWFRKLGSKNRQVGELDVGFFKLYAFLDERRKKLNISQDALCEVLNIASTDTYRSYRREWEAFEQDVRRNVFPNRRMSREQMFCLVVLLQLDYATAVLILGAGGYGFHDSETDCVIVKYLLSPEAERSNRRTQQAVLSRLHP